MSWRYLTTPVIVDAPAPLWAAGTDPGITNGGGVYPLAWFDCPESGLSEFDCADVPKGIPKSG